jgi:RHS repeat-associated protein
MTRLNVCASRSTGKERDAESGLDYFGARYYSSTMGRFSSPDPSGLYYADLSNPQSFNLYSYALNNPLKNTDPTGMYCYYGSTEYDVSDDSQYDFHSSVSECTATDENGNTGTWVDDPSTEVNVSANGDGSMDSYSSSFDGTVVTPYDQHSEWQGDSDDKRIQTLSSNINTNIGPLLNIGNCGVHALIMGVGSFLGYDPAPGSSDVVKTIRQGAEAALAAKGGYWISRCSSDCFRNRSSGEGSFETVCRRSRSSCWKCGGKSCTRLTPNSRRIGYQ